MRAPASRTSAISFSCRGRSRMQTVMSDTDAVRWMLEGRERHLAKVGDAGDFARRVLEMLDHPVADYGTRAEWKDVAAQLEQNLRMGLQ